jgi:hypothetical protein
MPWGEGEVLCFADDTAYWDFCAQRDAELRVPNAATTRALFRCLLPDKKPSGQPGTVRRVRGEQTLSLNGLSVFYSNPVAPFAKTLLDKLPRIVALVEQMNGRPTESGYFGVHILATGGGGWAGGHDIGVQCVGSSYGNIAVIAHELTHTLEGPLPGVVAEGWASMVGWRVGAELGFFEDAARERASFLARFEEYEQNGRKLDITIGERERSVFAAAEGKTMWLIEQLEAQYGPDFMPRFIEIRHALHGRNKLDIQQVLSLFSLTAGRDLAPYFRELRITVEDHKPISPEVLQQKLESYRKDSGSKVGH